MKKILSLFIAFLLLCGSVCAQQHYLPDNHMKNANTPIVAKVFIEGETPETLSTIELGAFVNDTLCGSAFVSVDLDNTYWIQVFYNEVYISGEWQANPDAITFKIYDHSSGLEYATCPTTLTTASEGYGTQAIPVELDFRAVVTQSVGLAYGYNWISTYIDGDPIELLEALQDGLGNNGMSIEGPDGINENLGDGFWWGDLDEIGIASGTMYLIQVEDDCTVELTGMPVNPAAVEITINPGYTWIGFPGTEEVEVESAMSSFDAEDGDAIEGPEGITEYLGDGVWWGDFDMFVPGQGYLYNSASGEVKTLVFQTGGSKARAKNAFPKAKPIVKQKLGNGLKNN